MDERQRPSAFDFHSFKVGTVSRWNLAKGLLALDVERRELIERRFYRYIFAWGPVDQRRLPAVPDLWMVSDPFDRDLEEQTTEASASARLRVLRIEAQVARAAKRQ